MFDTKVSILIHFMKHRVLHLSPQKQPVSEYRAVQFIHCQGLTHSV